MKNMLKWPLIIAAVVIVVRIGLEQMGAPEVINNIFGVSWLFFLVPVYFAIKIAASQDRQPYKTLFKYVLLFAVYARLMVVPTYWLAYAFNWTQARFSLQQGGVVGASPLNGYLVYPLRNLLIWVVAALIIGGIIGSITLAIARRNKAQATA